MYIYAPKARSYIIVYLYYTHEVVGHHSALIFFRGMDFRIALIFVPVLFYVLQLFLLGPGPPKNCENFYTSDGAVQQVKLQFDGQLKFELTCLPTGRHVIDQPHKFRRFGVCPNELTNGAAHRLEKWIKRQCNTDADSLDIKITSALRIKDPNGRPYLVPPDFPEPSMFPLEVSGKILSVNVLDVSPNEEPIILKDSFEVSGTKVWAFERFHSLAERIEKMGYTPLTEDLPRDFESATIVHIKKLYNGKGILIRISNGLNIFLSIEEDPEFPSPPAEECSICLELLNHPGTRPSQLACRHWFHAECIDSWLSVKETCPYCNQPAILVGTKKPHWRSIFLV
jgi:hypothetical protein